MAAGSSKGSQKARSPFASRSDAGQSKSPRRNPQSSSSLTLEEESELRQFLKLVRGVEWGCRARKRGHSDVKRVIEKLKAIGVSDVSELLRRVSSRKINEELAEAGYPRFSKDTLESIRKQSSFIRALENLNESNYRQIGPLAPAPQMLSSENLVYRASQMPSGLRASLSSARPPPDAGSPPRRRQEDAGAKGPGLGVSVSSAFLHMCSEDAQTEDGLTYMPLHLRGVRHQKTRGGSLSQSSALAASLPDLSRPEPRMPQAESARSFNQSRLSTDSQAPRCYSSPMGEQERGAPGGAGGARMRLSSGNISATASEPSPVRSSPMAAMPEVPPGGSPNRSRSVSFKAPPGLDTPRLMEKLMRASMQITSEQRAARWTSLNHAKDSLLHHGEAMLKEQNALEARTTLFRNMESEGVTSPLRQHVARKIRGRLREEQERDGQGTLDQVEIQQRSINIRKHLGLMSNLRRELQVLKRNAFDDEDDSRSKAPEETAFMRGAWMAQR